MGGHVGGAFHHPLQLLMLERRICTCSATKSETIEALAMPSISSRVIRPVSDARNRANAAS
jgi:hypothetical protein